MQTNSRKIHESVMVDEVLAHIKNQALPHRAEKVIDGTLGTGGHTLEMVKQGIEVLGIEQDPKMLSLASERLKGYKNAKLVLGNFTKIKLFASQKVFNDVDAVLLDLGVTNLHLVNDNRGFSFARPKDPLDMRLNTDSQGVTAADLLNVLRADQLEKLFSVTMDYSSVKWIVKQVTEIRRYKPIKNVEDMLDITENLKYQKASLNKATLPFLALRIAVNGELDNLKDVLPKAYNLLKPNGKLLIITFHSGEERIVKEFDNNVDTVLPSKDEILGNPRSRSAKLKIITKKN